MIGKDLAESMSITRRWRPWFGQYTASFSYVGLAVGTLFFSVSLSPSLLPRNYLVQGVLSGLALTVGYGGGISLVWLWRYFQLPDPGPTIDRIAKAVTWVSVAGVAGFFLWRATIWQNSIRELMDMEPLGSAHPWRV